MVGFTSGSVVDSDPELVTQWREALTDVLDQAMNDEEGYKAAVTEFTGMPAETVDVIRYERLSGELDPQIIIDLSALAAKWGFIETEPDLDVVIAE